MCSKKPYIEPHKGANGAQCVLGAVLYKIDTVACQYCNTFFA
mgnify:CR=1 FL=1